MTVRFPEMFSGLRWVSSLYFPQSDGLFHQTLREQINLKDPLVRRVDLIDWNRIVTVCAKRFPSGRGRPATTPRLIVELLYLQHAFDLSDEDPVWG